jgi:7-carboxy-7-deazaguanine synthase
MIKSLIKANPDFVKTATSPNGLEVAEFFYDTIQGEGINIGHPAAFLRLQHCSLDCTWCDTQEVWRYGNPYSFDELFELMENAEHSKNLSGGIVELSYEYSLIDKLQEGQHLVITGGSPLKQQYQLAKFLTAFLERYHFKPYVEIENECVIMPTVITNIDCWNNSPKLSSSGNKRALRYKPEVIKHTAGLVNSWFKFVICDETDWEEIQMDFLDPGLIEKSQIILMPMGETKVELERNRDIAVKMAVSHNVRFTDRLHITLWDKKTGV